MAFFMSSTSGHTLIIGRKTFASIPRPQTDRRLIVVSSRSLGDRSDWPGVTRVGSFDEAIELVADEPVPIVAGGAAIYAAAMPLITEIWWSELKLADFVPQPGDTLMPEPPWDEFELVATQDLSPRVTVRRFRRMDRGALPCGPGWTELME